MNDIKVSPGYATIEEEFEASLTRAFVVGRSDYIVLHNRRYRFLFECAAYGQRMGWLTETEIVEVDDQNTEWRLRLTEKGKKHFGI